MDEQRRLILDQFTRQAAPFAEMHAQDDASVLQLLLATADVGPDDDVLDVACGPGLVACEAAKIARHVTGIDLTPAMIAQARARQQTLGLTNLTWMEGDAQPLPFGDGSFSRVVTRYSFHHFTDPKGAFAEMARVCSGRITVCDVFTTSASQAEAYDRMEQHRDPSHTHALLLAEFDALFEGLRDVRREFYLYPVKVDDLLARSFPGAGGAEEFRRIVREDFGVDRLGIRSTGDGFSFPVVVVSGAV